MHFKTEIQYSNRRAHKGMENSNQEKGEQFDGTKKQ